MTTSKQWFDEALDDYKDDPEFLARQLLIAVTEEIARLMDECGMTRTKLANKLGVKPPLISRILRAQPNITILTLMKIALALDRRISLRLVPRFSIVNSSIWSDTASMTAVAPTKPTEGKNGLGCPIAA